MGRGGDTLDILGKGSISIPIGVAARSTRTLNRKLFTDKTEWLKQEKKFIDDVRDDLQKAVASFAATDEGWRSYLQIYARTPDYSALNNLWARLQLHHKDVDPRGIILSESQWAKLGRRVKAEYAMPSKSPRSPAGRRDKKYGYDSDRDWDDRYCVELMRPLGGGKFVKKLTDANGNPILDEDGNQKTRTFYKSVQGFGAFKAYHEDATEDIAGGPAKPLPASPWAGASGTDADAEKLIEDLRDRVAGVFGVEVREDLDSDPGRLSELSNKDRVQTALDGRDIADLTDGGKVLRVNPNAPVTARAVAMLAGLAEAASTDIQPRNDDDRLRQRAAIASTTYAISSLYGLDSGAETFPQLAQIAEQDNGLRRLDTEIHARTSRILGLIDPRMRAKALGREDEPAGGSRAARRAKQSGRPRDMTAAILG